MSLAELSQIWKPYTHRQWIRKQINKDRLATQMRNNPTPAEAKAWTDIFQPINRTTPFIFRRQYKVYGYIIDFYCHYLRLGIEIDGSIHGTQQQQTWDRHREHNLNREGISLLRFTNQEVFSNPEQVKQQINNYITTYCESQKVEVKI